VAEQLQGKPGLDVLVEGLLDAQLGGPLDVVALVFGQDAGLGDGQVLSVQGLHGLELEEARSGVVGRQDVLGQLGVGAGRGAEGRLEVLAKKAQPLSRRGDETVVQGEEGALLPLLEDPVHQFMGTGVGVIRSDIRVLLSR